MAKAYQYDASGYFAGEYDDFGFLPSNATHIPPPAGPWDHVWPHWTGDVWEMVEDHRERKEPYFQAEHEQEGTPYWLSAEGDNWQNQPRTMKEPGSLPDGALLKRPEKPLSVVQEQKRREIDAGYESALVAALTMPAATPTPMIVAVETSALLAVDPDAVDSIKAALDTRRADLLRQVDAAETVTAVEAIVVSYPV